LMTRDTVALETPASFAIPRISMMRSPGRSPVAPSTEYATWHICDKKLPIVLKFRTNHNITVGFKGNISPQDAQFLV
jgi:hypothetical protein